MDPKAHSGFTAFILSYRFALSKVANAAFNLVLKHVHRKKKARRESNKSAHFANYAAEKTLFVRKKETFNQREKS